MKTLNIDIETYSDEDLTKVGVYKYADSPNFEILLFAYSIDGQPVECEDLTLSEIPDEIVAALTDKDVLKIAFNAQFERVCLSKYLSIPYYLDPSQWHCTMVHANELGLPASLGQCAKYLNIEQQKDTRGTQLINFFSKPCKPTKKNGMRTRNLPEHDPEKWQTFTEYCIQDVNVEMAIANKLNRFPVPESEWELYTLDQRINDRGAEIDHELATAAIDIMADLSEAGLNEMKELTGLENPNSLAQLKKWLEEQGTPFEKLGKEIVLKALAFGNLPDNVAEVLKLRLSLSNSSTKKYLMMDNARCSDNRIHGILQFYGANRTGRWAGRLLQVQNLPRNYLSEIDFARQLVKAKDVEGIELMYEDVPDTLKQLIRTGLVAKEGHRFIVSDFSAIEARVIAWYAKQDWVLEVFRTHGKIYEATAAQMFHLGEVTDYDWKSHEGKDMRQRGKVAQLACIAEGQPVLTDTGLVPIEKVTTDMKVWDGTRWVTHEGVVYKGEKEVISYEGLTATADHIVWAKIGREYMQIRFGEAVRNGYHLAKTGAGRRNLWLGDYCKPNKDLEERLERSPRNGSVQRMWENFMGSFLQPETKKISGLSKMHAKKSCSKMVRKKIHCSKTALYKSKLLRVSELWGSWDKIPVRFTNKSRTLYDKRKWSATKSRIRNRQNRQRWALRRRESSMGHQEYAVKKSAKTYDLMNAGPNHRFTVSDVLVHNCGYQGGPGALKAMGALEQGVPEEELQELINAWRKANQKIVRFWHETQKAVIDCLQNGGIKKGPRGLKFYKKAGFLFIQLPSGRKLAYAKAHLEQGDYGPAVFYEGQGDKVMFTKQQTYGGKLVENIVQATARDVLAEAMLRLEREGYLIVFHVHDEAVAEVPDGEKSIEEMNEIMSVVPEWAEGLPLNAEGFETKYYMKD